MTSKTVTGVELSEAVRQKVRHLADGSPPGPDKLP
jgi:hypothetical protein